jgi:fatty acid desaturase
MTRRSSDLRGGWEWRTLLVAAGIYAAFAALTLNHASLPWWLLVVAGGFVTAWHGSLQHEVVHGHPTPHALLNELLVFPGLWLWLPFRLYRQSHLRHHAITVIGDPVDDPESYYLDRERWSRLGPVQRAFWRFHNTLSGRLTVGPAVAVARLLAEESRKLAQGDFSALPAWLLHAAGCAMVLAWAVGFCGMSVVEYVAFFAYPGLSLTLLRSFAEHQASVDQEERTVIVNCGPVMSLLFLNNNLHAVHHAEPSLPWYLLPARARSSKLPAYAFRSYLEIAGRHLFKPKEPVRFPL